LARQTRLRCFNLFLKSKRERALQREKKKRKSRKRKKERKKKKPNQ